MKQPNNIALTIAIIFASAAVSGSMVFFGMQISGKASVMDWDKFVAKVGEGVETFVNKQQSQQINQQQQQNADKAEKAKAIKKLDASRDHVQGKADAEITLYEYSDYVCPYCARFHPIAKKALEQNGDKINWVFRHWPLPGHDPIATMAAMGGECATEMGGNAKFWEYTDNVFAADSSGVKIGSVDDLASIAQNIGIDSAKFKTCVESNKYLSRVQEDLKEGTDAGVEGTPGNILVNNKTGEVLTIDGAQPIEAVQAAIDKISGK
jgi:protein-disulfide isomerase